MECPHLCDSVKVNRDFIKNKKCELNASPTAVEHASTPSTISAATNSSNTTVASPSTRRSPPTTATSSNKLWKCSECTSSTENWMCLNCGQVLCGRYVNGHALHHSNANRQHYVCLNTLDCSVFCYKCDDFVINDTAKNLLYNLRQELKDDDTSSEASSSLDELLSSSSYQESGSSTSSSDSGWFEETANGSKGGRTLRPRKRTISNDVSGGSGNNNKSTSSSSSGEPTNKKPLRKIVGLRNLGNTCFINSVVQSLSNIRDFSCFFNSLPSLETKPSPQQQLQPTPPKRVYYSRSYKENESSMNEANVAEELRKILSDLNHGGDGSKAVSPECFILVIWKVVPQFRGHRQHDAHEFLRYMLDRLHTELQCLTAPLDVVNATHAKLNGKLLNGIGNGEANNITFRGKSSIVTNVFGGTLQSEVRCLICGMESKKHDPFLDLSLDIPERFYKDSDGRKPCSIADCLSSFTEIEELAETELYYCNSCKCKQKSTKRFWVRRLPNVLCLHIKRFRWNNFFRTKIDLRIKFPIKSLDMSPYVLNNGPETRRNSSSNNVYDLAAVVVHHGNGSSRGHYTSFAINNGTWVHFNDHLVREVLPAEVAACKPYILFYIRRDATKTS